MRPSDKKLGRAGGKVYFVKSLRLFISEFRKFSEIREFKEFSEFKEISEFSEFSEFSEINY